MVFRIHVGVTQGRRVMNVVGYVDKQEFIARCGAMRQVKSELKEGEMKCNYRLNEGQVLFQVFHVHLST
jgi:hypothetical protein